MQSRLFSQLGLSKLLQASQGLEGSAHLCGLRGLGCQLTDLRSFAVPARKKETDLPLSAPLTYSPKDVPPRQWTPNRNARKRPPEMSEGRILCVLSHKDLKSLVNQAVDALKKATQWRAGSITSDALMHCLQSAAASRGKAFQLAQGQMVLVPKQNKLITFAIEGFMGKVAVHIPDSQWTFLRNQEVKYNDNNCLVHHLAGYRMEDRGLTIDDVVAKMPGPPKSKTSYQAYFKSDFVRVSPDWVLEVVMEANDENALPPRKSERSGKKLKWKPTDKRKQRFDVGKAKMQTLEEQGVPWYWLHNSWDSTLQVFRHTTPHKPGGKYDLVEEYSLGANFDKKERAQPFQDASANLRASLGWRENRIAFA